MSEKNQGKLPVPPLLTLHLQTEIGSSSGRKGLVLDHHDSRSLVHTELTPKPVEGMAAASRCLDHSKSKPRSYSSNDCDDQDTSSNILPSTGPDITTGPTFSNETSSTRGIKPPSRSSEVLETFQPNSSTSKSSTTRASAQHFSISLDEHPPPTSLASPSKSGGAIQNDNLKNDPSCNCVQCGKRPSRWSSLETSSVLCSSSVLHSGRTLPEPLTPLGMDGRHTGKSPSKRQKLKRKGVPWGAIWTWVGLKPSRNTKEGVAPALHDRILEHMIHSSSGLPQRPPDILRTSSEKHYVPQYTSGGLSGEASESSPVAANFHKSVPKNDGNSSTASGANVHSPVLPICSLEELMALPLMLGDAHDPDGRNADFLEAKSRSLPTLQELTRDKEGVDLGNEVTISRGDWPIVAGMSIVFRGWWKGRLVAVKIPLFRGIQSEDEGHRRTKREIRLATAVKHKNINEFIGYTDAFHDQKYRPFSAMISMWCQHGTITDYLTANVPVLQRILLAQGISAGLQYLHQLGLIHGDIKPSNILVDNNLVARLCDLGCARPIPGHGSGWMLTRAPYAGTDRYKARELFMPGNSHPTPTLEGDIYSLGCVLLETIELIYTFGGVPPEVLEQRIKDGALPASQEQSASPLAGYTDHFWDLLKACWSNAVNRPPIDGVVETLSFIESHI